MLKRTPIGAMQGALTALTCPACMGGTLEPCEQTVDLEATLEDWATTVGSPLPAPLRAQYAASPFPRLHECPACGFGVFLPIKSGSTEFYSFIAAVDYYVSDRWDLCEGAKLVAHLRPQAVLDIGCGVGHFLDKVKSCTPSIRTSGLDMNGAMVARELAERGHLYAGADLSEAPTACADVVSALQVLEHVPEPDAFIDECVRLLRPEGHLLLSMPDAQSLVGRFTNSLTEIPPHHVTRWTERALRALLQRHGLSVERIARQPLERYQWDSYLAAAVEADTWLGGFLRPFLHPEESAQQWADKVRQLLDDRQVDCIHGIASHTMLVLVRRDGDIQGDL